MNKKELVERIVATKELSHLTKKDVMQVLNTFISTTKDSVKNNEAVTLVGFGTFTKAHRKARVGIDPNTYEKIKINSKYIPKFRPGMDWREMVSKR